MLTTSRVVLCCVVQHSQEKAKLSEQLRTAECERKSLEDKVSVRTRYFESDAVLETFFFVTFSLDFYVTDVHLSLTLSSSFFSLSCKLKDERQNLTAKNEALQAELDFTCNQLTTKKTQVSGTYMYVHVFTFTIADIHNVNTYSVYCVTHGIIMSVEVCYRASTRTNFVFSDCGYAALLYINYNYV